MEILFDPQIFCRDAQLPVSWTFYQKPTCTFKILECYLADQLNRYKLSLLLSDDLWLNLEVQVEQSAFQTTPETQPILLLTPERVESAMGHIPYFMFGRLGEKLGELNFVGYEMVWGV